MPRPRLLDLYCGAGGASMGYFQAGFEVVGVDIEPQPSYPFPFIQADALEIPLGDWDVIHASPPCQLFSDLRSIHPTREYEDLIGPTRERLLGWGGTYIIENVERSPLIDPIMLCGTMFSTLRVIRHRLFEANVKLEAPRCQRPHPRVFTFDKRKKGYGKLDPRTSYIQVTGHCAPALEARKAMNINWVRNREELNQMIPPPYTRYIGRQLREIMSK